jgi:hypothetical protein
MPACITGGSDDASVFTARLRTGAPPLRTQNQVGSGHR